MTLVQLQYVLSLAEHKNFTIAADRSFVTQPTLSMQIQKLEKELEVEIFNRSTHPITITPIGQKIIDQSKQILYHAKRMQQLVYEEKNRMRGTITLGIIPTILPTLLPLFYKNFKKKYPSITLKIKELNTINIIDKLRDGSLDFGIAATPLLENKIIEKTLYFEPLVAYIPSSHTLNKLEKIDEGLLDIKSILLLEEGHCFRNNVLRICNSTSIKSRNVDLESGSFSTLIKLSNDGFGMTLLPLLYSKELHEKDKINIRHFNDPMPTREISLLYHHNQIRLNFATNFIELIQSIIRGILYLESSNAISPKLSLAL